MKTVFFFKERKKKESLAANQCKETHCLRTPVLTKSDCHKGRFQNLKKLFTERNNGAADDVFALNKRLACQNESCRGFTQLNVAFHLRHLMERKRETISVLIHTLLPHNN